MKELKFIEGALPKGFKPDFESFLFNDERHRQLQSRSGWQSYCLLREDKKRVLASIHFHLENDTAQSPYKAPFGSMEFSKTLQPKDLHAFLKGVESRLVANGIKKIRIKNWPEAYQPVASSLLEVLFLNLGYHINQAEMAAVIPIGKARYDELIEGWELRKLKQGKKANLSFQELAINRLEEVYEFIKYCREERKQSLSMSLTELMKTVEAFSENFALFGVFQGKELAAASISIRVSKKIIYNFYSAHLRRMDALSPVVSLIQGIYDWSQRQQIEMIDLGTSALDGQPNFGLLDFKLRLGGKLSSKFTFEKDLI